MNYEGLYLIKEREFIRCNDNVYKLGKSQNILDRVKSYPKESMLHLLIFCKDSNNYEKELIKILTKKFKLVSNYGAEYFDGKLNKIILEIEKFMNNKKCIFCITNNIMTHTVNQKTINDKNIIKKIYPFIDVVNDDIIDVVNDVINDDIIDVVNDVINDDIIDVVNDVVNDDIIDVVNIVNLLNNYKGKRIIHKCILCNFSSTQKTAYNTHLLTQKHKRNYKDNLNLLNNKNTNKIIKETR